MGGLNFLAHYSPVVCVSGHWMFGPMLRMGEQFKVFWIYTSWVLACVMDLCPVRNGESSRSLVYHCVDWGSNSPHRNSPVRPSFLARPVKTPVLSWYGFREYFLKDGLWDFIRSYSLPFLFVVGAAETSIHRGGFTPLCATWGETYGLG